MNVSYDSIWLDAGFSYHGITLQSDAGCKDFLDTEFVRMKARGGIAGTPSVVARNITPAHYLLLQNNPDVSNLTIL